MQRPITQPSPANFDNVDLICFSHLRWGFVYQRPQHLMSRFAKCRRVFFFEEPVFHAAGPELRVSVCPQSGVYVTLPVLPEGTPHAQVQELLRELLASLLRDHFIDEYAAWFYTPMALNFAADLHPLVTIYDCMDELSFFRGAPPELLQRESELFKKADLVFTGGLSLFEAKRRLHLHVHAFPSSVDVPHFARARSLMPEPPDQQSIPHPRIGYVGVIDERIDISLIAEVARLRPGWHIVMLGPVVKIAPESLPQSPNIHYLGMKQYAELPAYLSSWDAAMLPFALNDATLFISPTKTPEYLAAGLPVVSTPIRDVVRPYGEMGLARIAAAPVEFVAALDLLASDRASAAWREKADSYLAGISWDITWNQMNNLILQAMAARRQEFSVETTTSAAVSN